MNKLNILWLILLLGCDLGTSPHTDKNYSTDNISATIWLNYTNSYYYTNANVINASDSIGKNITVGIRDNLPRNRVIFDVTLRESVFGYDIIYLYKTDIHDVKYDSIQQGTIQKLEYPYVTFDVGKYNYYSFINEYRSTPPYGIGDLVNFVSYKDTLMAIKEE